MFNLIYLYILYRHTGKVNLYISLEIRGGGTITPCPKLWIRNGRKIERKEVGILTWGLENYAPAQNISEDEASISNHTEWMQREWRKSEPDLPIVDMKMDLTFPSRRNKILADTTTKEVIEEYRGFNPTDRWDRLWN